MIHDVLPALGWYDPPGHLVGLVDPPSHFEPAGQVEHEIEPEELLYVPPGQDEQLDDPE